MKIRPFRLTIKPQIGDHPIPKILSDSMFHFDQLLDKIFTETRFEDTDDFLEWTHEHFPFVRWEEQAGQPDCLNLFIFCREDKESPLGEFIHTFIMKRVFPEKTAIPLSFQYLSCGFEEIPDVGFFICNLQFLLVSNGRVKYQIRSDLPRSAQDIALAFRSPDFAKYVLQTGVPFNPKNAAIFEKLVPLIKKIPHHFDNTLLNDFIRLLGLSNLDFLVEREALHLTRLICSHFVIYKHLARLLRLLPEERHLFLRFMNVRLTFPFGTKSVLGLCLGICPLNEYEHFEEKHILMAIQHSLPSANIVQNSFYISQKPRDLIRLLYVELEKDDGKKFSLDEVRTLKALLPETLKTRVEKVLPSLFMPRNEEEVMKRILTLEQELRYRDSLPQVMISFDSQSPSELFFTVIVVHLMKKTGQSFEDRVIKTDACTWVPNRIQLVNYLSDKTAKEAVVFHVKMEKDASLLRADFSVNFYLARLKLVEALQELFGPIRDYNGGLIFQQGEQLAEFKRTFPQDAVPFPDLMENFFYSLTPIEAQSTLSQQLLKKLFSLCLEAIDALLPKKENYFFKTETKEAHTFVIVRMKDSSMKTAFLEALDRLGIDKSIVSTAVTLQGSSTIGYIHTASPAYSKEQFLTTIEQAMSEAVAKMNSSQILRLAFPNLPVSFDPRIGGDVCSAMVLKMLFEGLMKYGDDGELTYGICESVTISSDAKMYIFTLRQTFWSNGTPVTAHDFAYAWKKILSPNFYTPYTYLFYPIKFAKLIKEGNASPNQLGVQAFDDHTLLVELEHPTPYFLELTALSIYSPVPCSLNEAHPNWAQQVGSGYVCNGPFLLTKRSREQGVLELSKNPLYWDLTLSQPDQVLIMQGNDHAAFQMFKNDEIDWFGSPLQAWNLRLFGESHDHIESLTSSGVFWSIFNLKRFPFNNLKLRQAFAYAINRKLLIETFAYEGFPAFSPLPRMHSQQPEAMQMDGDEAKALRLFHEALEELGITKKEFPRLLLIHGIQDIFLSNVIEFLASEWQRIFAVDCKIETHSWSTAFDKFVQGDFQIGFTCWEAWVNDPIYTLNAFKFGDDKMNFAKWENEQFRKLLDLADKTTDLQKRSEYLCQAEAILIQEVPVVPVLCEVQQFIKKNYVCVPIHKNSATFSFRSASIHKNLG